MPLFRIPLCRLDATSARFSSEQIRDFVIVTLFFAIFFTLFLLTASFSVHDARWPVSHTSFREFLKSNIRIGRGTMSGREVLFEIALIPVALAFGATLIGLAWVIFG